MLSVVYSERKKLTKSLEDLVQEVMQVLNTELESSGFQLYVHYNLSQVSKSSIYINYHKSFLVVEEYNIMPVTREG